MKRTLLLVLIILSSIETFGSFWMINLTHSICVERIECWSPQYLTVTCNYNNKLFLSAPSTLKVLSVITEINGKSTEFMDTDEFYNILDTNTDIKLTYWTKINGENMIFSETLRKFKGKALIARGYYFNIVKSKSNRCDGWYYQTISHKNYELDNWRGGGGLTSLGKSYKTDKNVVISDMETDFSLFNTFDYAYNDANDELEQKQLLREFASVLESRGMKKVDKNPDVYLYVTLQSDRSIESVYMPKQVTNYNANAYGRITYGYYSTYGYGSAHAQTVTEEQGRMESFTTNDAYLQITMLDANRMDGPQPPKVWQYTYLDRNDMSLTSTLFREKTKDFTAIYPFYTEYIYKWKAISEDYFGEFISTDGQGLNYLGLYVDSNNIVTGTISNSFADMYGIKDGDQMIIKRSGNNTAYYKDSSRSGAIRIGNKTITNKMLNRCENLGRIAQEKYYFIGSED